MFSLSTKSEYGLLLLSILAKKGKGLVPLSILTKETHLPYPFLSRIATELVGGGILESKEGINGGYRLAKQPKEVTVSEIVEILDGPWVLTKCNGVKDTCRYLEICPMRGKWKGLLKQKIRKVLNSFTLKDLIS